MSSTTFSLVDVPPGRLVVEASAGTGKTHALAGLAVHLLGKGEVTVDGLLVVTYTRLATAELRGRIRTMLAMALRDLDVEQPASDVAEIVASLRDGNADAARANLRQALRNYDAVTVTTIHGFAQRALVAFGSVAGIDPDFTVLADSSRVVRDAFNDECAIAAALLAKAAAGADGTPEFDAGRLPAVSDADLANTLDNTPDLLLLPELEKAELDDVATLVTNPEVPPTTVKAALLTRAVHAAEHWRQGAGIRSYAELLSGLRDALGGPAGDTLAARLGNQFRVALVDEFQDTDRIQWDIFDRCFGRDGGRLVLVGDPKQAIYGFRGANVHTYADAIGSEGTTRRVLDTNWRSDGAVLQGLETLWRGVTFGAGIGFEPVGPAPGNEGSRLHRPDGETAHPVEIAFADTDELKDQKATLSAPRARNVVDRYLVDHVIDLLDNVQITDKPDNKADDRVDEPAGRPIRPDDIAILTRSNAECNQVAAALRNAGIPAVVHGAGDVRTMESPVYEQKKRASRAATEWRMLLHALADPSDSRLARTVATGVFGPLRRPADLIGVDEVMIADFQRRLADWAATLAGPGAPALVGRIWAESDVQARVLGEPEGDRFMTDLEHLGELVCSEAGSGPAVPERLLTVLDVAIDEGEEGMERITARRIPTGDPAVTVMTVHKSKGLQFPVVGCVGLHKLSFRDLKRAYDPDRRCQVMDLEKSDDFKAAARGDAVDENLRLLYVALTRAKHHTFTCWTHEQNSPNASLTRVLFARNEDGTIDSEAFAAEKVTPPTAPDAIELLELLAGASGKTLGFRVLGAKFIEGDHSVWTGAGTASSGGYAGPLLEAAELGRDPDRRAGRWSFTAITATGGPDHDPSVPAGGESGTDEGVTVGVDDGAPTPGAVEDGDSTVSPLAGLPAGTAFGTLAHDVLEQVDFTVPDLAGAVRSALVRAQSGRSSVLSTGRRDGDPADPEQRFVDGLVAAIEAPLGPLWQHRRLRDLDRRDRLAECVFDLRLDAPADRPVTATLIGQILADHLAADDPYRPWAEGLAAGRFRVDLAGHLTGSIDLVARIHTDGGPRYVISDYKTNRLHDAGTVPGPNAYGPTALVAGMVAHDYPLQALLYTVALHRYLRWRQPGYDPAVHLGGVTYLFLRGMVPVGTSGGAARTADDPAGIADWRIPTAVIEELDARFAGRKGSR